MNPQAALLKANIDADAQLCRTRRVAIMRLQSC
jgi:hypothetical protein